MIVHVKGAESGMGMLMKAMGMGGGKTRRDAHGASVKKAGLFYESSPTR
ncbi:MAG: hypothetical protein ACLVJ8_09990 [Ruthenibacterium lactatiformans]